MPRAGSVCLPKPDTIGGRLRVRADFLALRASPSVRRRGFILAGGVTRRSQAGSWRVGFTVTKKLGNAVVRNRIKRRLRHAMDRVMPRHGLAGHDYVLIGRPAARLQPFDSLVSDLESAVREVNRKSASKQA